MKAALERDVALGVIERVPVNTPVTWCSRMHVVGKKDGSCRRTVDLRPLNSATTAQTHLTQSPITQVQKVEDADELEEAVLAKIASLMVSWPGLQVASEADEEIREVCRLL